MVAVLETGKTTVILIVIEGLVGAEFYDLNGGLIARKLDVLGLIRS